MKSCILNQNFFKEHECSSFVLLKDKDQLLDYLKDFNLPYQYKINIDPMFQYGTEIEFANAELKNVEEDISKSYGGIKPVYSQEWYSKEENTINRTDSPGGEVVSPISYNEPDDWKKLDEICNILKDNGAIITDDCALHVHIDFKRLNFTPEHTEKLLKLWAIYENVIYKFAVCEEKELRHFVYQYANPIRNIVIEMNKKNTFNFSTKSEFYRRKKYYGIKLRNLIQYFNKEKYELSTIEFRVANGSLNPKIIQNVIRFFCQLVNSVINEDPLVDYYIDKHFNNLKVKKDIEELILKYQEIDFDKSLELADIIYNNNLDKLCFLKQYLKDNEIEEARVYVK